MLSLAEEFKTNYKDEEINAEAERLLTNLMHVQCEPGRVWNLEKCKDIAPLTLEINKIKKEKGAIILAHSYVYPEIIYGVADYKGDSYFLSDMARKNESNMIVFAGVVFMAETAKILSPESTVVVPDIESGCSLADSLTGEDMKELKAKYPNATAVCYINSSAEIKSHCDVCVTSSNVYKIIEEIDNEEILFVPDKLMAQNIRNEMAERGVKKTIYTSEGVCIVHEEFDPKIIDAAKARNPEVKIVSHPECTEDVTSKSDFVGSTGKMMDYVRQTDAQEFMLLTECGLVGRLETELPDKSFTPSCRLCPYMKMNSLEKVYQALIDPRADQEVRLDETLRLNAKHSIDEMFRLADA